jgi:hypothetical protein
VWHLLQQRQRVELAQHGRLDVASLWQGKAELQLPHYGEDI